MTWPSLNALNCGDTLRAKDTILPSNEAADRKNSLDWAIRSQGTRKLVQGSTTKKSNLTHNGTVKNSRKGRFFLLAGQDEKIRYSLDSCENMRISDKEPVDNI
jgi:hypothetical protein